eukprot:2979352-Amphidinium_carterae.1
MFAKLAVQTIPAIAVTMISARSATRRRRRKQKPPTRLGWSFIQRTRMPRKKTRMMQMTKMKKMRTL